MNYIPTIGMEIHAELSTNTKMFCSSKNDPNETRPNVNICPVCMGHPGTLPTINKEAVKQVLRVGTAVGGTIADYTEFDRKNYFYPDIPKGYQLSQYKHPLVSGGELDGVTITRIHLEEDTARSQHDRDLPDLPSGKAGGEAGQSFIDFNRSGVPLMELVTEPVIHSAKDAAHFARELQILLRTLAVSEANMEKGEMRVEANISVAPEGSKDLGTKVEIKNLNSFRSVERAIEYEIARHIKALETGEIITQETRGWNEEKGITFPQRTKEHSHDYRYFPDPDLPKLWVSEISDFENLSSTLPELPWQKRERLTELGIKLEDAEMYVADEEWATFFDNVSAVLSAEPKLIVLASNYITSDLVGICKADNTVELPDPAAFAGLIRMVAGGELSSRGAKNTLLIMVEEGGEPHAIAERENLLQVHDEGVLLPIIEKVMTANPTAVAELRGGKEQALQFLVGVAMRESKGSANPKKLAQLFRQHTT